MNHNYGIDLLKIVAMFMVVMGHVILSGGVNEAVSQGALRGSPVYYTVFGIRLITICAVNCFVLATGYLYYGRKVKLARIGELWLQILFLSVLVLVVSLALGYRPAVNEYLKTFLPLSTYHYWFVTQYVLLMLFVPFLNRMIECLSGRESAMLVVIMIFVFSILPTFLMPREIPVNGGYTVVWFEVLYVIGALVKKFDVVFRISRGYALAMFASSLVFGVLLSVCGSFIARHFGVGGGFLCYQYNAPTVLLEAVSLLLLFVGINICSSGFQKVIKIASSLVFGVYILHSNCIFRAVSGWNGRWSELSEQDPLLLVISLVRVSMLVFLGAMGIDLCRRFLFEKICNALSQRQKTSL